MKKKLLWILVAGVLAVGIGTLLVMGKMAQVFFEHAEDSQKEDQKAQTFIEEKYGMEAIIVSITDANFNEGQSYEMAFKEQQDIVFTVTVDTEDYATIYRDDYKILFAEHQAEQQVEELLPQIEERGFTKPLSGLLVQSTSQNIKTGQAVRWLTLETETSYDNIEKSEIESIIAVLNLLKNQDIDVQKIRFYNRWDQSKVDIDLREIADVQSDKEIEAYIRGQ
ncbi:hypothetical protein [Planococcus donghaensis]|uniref:Uncharacterized protein n=1 Tax=Planococcus donghaensis TaxID=414778 RepID=A0A1C7EES5_9BACL|nr:hypothetical protein [Planococcus donghaensis]ANU22464.1 hypothetical protein BCM40_03445 [Planococcus donghaensis]